MSKAFDGVQRIVLRGSPWQAAAHLMLKFDGQNPCHFMKRLAKQEMLSFVPDDEYERPQVQYSLGFTRRGLEHAAVPAHVLACFALKAPAYCAGAALRAALQLGLTDGNAPRNWDEPFVFAYLDAVLSIHVRQEHHLAKVTGDAIKLANACNLVCLELPRSAALPRPHGIDPPTDSRPPQWVHFDFRDSLSRIGIEGWTREHVLDECKPSSRHQSGEFILGHAQDSGANPWIAGPGLMVWPKALRRFFRNGSFGVLQQIEQDVDAFGRFVQASAVKSGLRVDEIKGKLCGRLPGGEPMVAPHADPTRDFDYAEDLHGYACPFGSHARRMNPRLPLTDAASANASRPGELLAQFSRTRALLRRGMPYGPPFACEPDAKRGLMAQFFCASIEDQYEHLLGQWADRVPLGSPDPGGARDPFIGEHQPDDGPFVIPKGSKPNHDESIALGGLQPFTRTRGIAYLFYPSQRTLRGIANSNDWGAVDKEENEDRDEDDE